MKINVFSIIRDHLITLYDDRSSKFSICDLVLFYVFPIIISTLSYLFNYYFSVEIYNISITFFGIFIALLLNMQIAIFSIFQRKWDIPTDEISKELKNDTLKDRKKILKELNANISYLILVCCASLVISLIFYAQHLESSRSVSKRV